MMLQLVSLVGSAFILVGYILLVTKKFNTDDVRFHWMNIVGCTITALTLGLGQFNLGSFVLQVVFGSVALYAIVTHYKKK